MFQNPSMKSLSDTKRLAMPLSPLDMGQSKHSSHQGTGGWLVISFSRMHYLYSLRGRQLNGKTERPSAVQSALGIKAELVWEHSLRDTLW